MSQETLSIENPIAVYRGALPLPIADLLKRWLTPGQVIPGSVMIAMKAIPRTGQKYRLMILK